MIFTLAALTWLALTSLGIAVLVSFRADDPAETRVAAAPDLRWRALPDCGALPTCD